MCFATNNNNYSSDSLGPTKLGSRKFIFKEMFKNPKI